MRTEDQPQPPAQPPAGAPTGEVAAPSASAAPALDIAPQTPEAPEKPALPSQKPAPAWETVVRWLRGSWRLTGSLIAIGIGLYGELALLERNEAPLATWCYIVAMALVIVSLTHWRTPGFVAKLLRRNARTSAEPQAAPSSPTVPVRKAGSRSGTAQTGAQAFRPWVAYMALRARLGWRATVVGLALTGALTLASALVLKDNTGNPLGAWLWAGAMAALLVTVLGVEGWPAGKGLLQQPGEGFFGRGVPVVPVRIETILVIAMMVLSIALRVWNLEYFPGIHGDEGERGIDARGIYEGRPDNIFAPGWWYVPNMYFYVMSVFFRVFGDTLIGARMVSVVFGVLAVWFVYKSARVLWGPRAGLIAGTMMAISPLALHFSRTAGESSVTGPLWAIGAYFLFMALRYRRWSDWVLAGFLWSWNLYFYPSGKMIIPLAGLAALYCLVRWRVGFFKKYALGFVLMGYAFLLMFMPYAIFSMQENWLSFSGRAQETSIFSPSNQRDTFARYGLTYDPAWGGKSLLENVKDNPAAWGGLVYQQARETLDGIYRRGDGVLFYYTTVNKGIALSPLWAVLGLLGLALALWRFWDARYGLALLWFAVGLSASFLTINTPNFQRFAGAWPAMMLFPAALLDRVAASAWPAGVRFARRWLALPIVALLAFFAVDSVREYFVLFPMDCPSCRDTVQARFVQGLGQEYKGYQLGVSGNAVYFTYGSTRFVAKGVEGTDVVAASDIMPVIDDNGKGLAFIVYPANNAYLPVIRELYPGGLEQQQKSIDGVIQFTTYQVTSAQLRDRRSLNAAYTAGGKRIERPEYGLGTQVAEGSEEWSPPANLTYPATAEWTGGLIAPSYGVYSFALDGTATGARLEIDGKPVVAEGVGDGKTGHVVLAKGLHDIRLVGTLSDADATLAVLWGGGETATASIEGRFLWGGSTGGLSGTIAPLPMENDPLVTPDPFGSKPVRQRRSDAFLAIYEGNTSFGQNDFMGVWRGSINVTEAGSYGFALNTVQQGAVTIDGRTVYGRGPDGQQGGGSVELQPGKHTIEVRVMSPGGSSKVELIWTPPGRQAEFVPQSVLLPDVRSWSVEEAPGAPPGALPAAEVGALGRLEPTTAMGDGVLKNPRGVAVDTQGNVYVGDRDNHRIVVFSPEGKVLHQWGTAAPAPPEGTEPKAMQGVKPGEFYDILDVSVAADGTVYVFDTSERVQAFTPEGKYIGGTEPGQLGLYGPSGTASGGNSLYIAVPGQNRILRVPPAADLAAKTRVMPNDGESIVLASDTGDHFEQPVDVAVDAASGALYVADLKDRVLKVERVLPRPGIDPVSGESQWKIVSQWSVQVGRADGGSRFALSPDGKRLYMTDPDRQRLVLTDTSTGRLRYLGGEGNAVQFGGLSGVAAGKDGVFYVLDRAKGVVLEFTLPVSVSK